MATCASKFAPQQRRRKVNRNLQRSPHYHHLQLLLKIPYAPLMQTCPTSHNHIKPPPPVTHQSSPLGRSTTQWRIRLQKIATGTTRDKGNCIRKSRETRDVGTTWYRWVGHRQCAKSLQISRNIHKKNEGRNNCTHCGILPTQHRNSTQLFEQQRNRSRKITH